MSLISIPYGSGDIEFPLPAGTEVERAPCVFPDRLDDVPGAVLYSLDNPRGGAPLSDMIPASGRVTVLVTDLTRGRTAASLLLPVLEYLDRHGAGPDRTSILIAGGMHLNRSEGEIESQLGSGIAERYEIVQHDARDEASLVYAGDTSYGTRCLFNRKAAESDLVVGLGAVSFHYFAGFGGGRKLILPGISGEETIMVNHRRSLREDPADGFAAGCGPGLLAGNPVHEDMMEGAALFPVPVFIVCALSGTGGYPCLISAGALEQAHLEAAERLRSLMAAPVGRRRGTVIASAGGSPKDINLLQAHKAVRHASRAVCDGGTLFMAAECGEGIGSDSLDLSFAGGREGVPSAVRQEYTLNSQAAMSIYEITGRIDVRLHSGLPEDVLRRFGFGPWRTDKTARLLEEISAGEVLVMEDAASFLPVID